MSIKAGPNQVVKRKGLPLDATGRASSPHACLPKTYKELRAKVHECTESNCGRIVDYRLTVNVWANTPLTDLIHSGFAAFTTIDGMPTVPASLRIGLGAKWKNSEGARQVPLPDGMTLAGT